MNDKNLAKSLNLPFLSENFEQLIEKLSDSPENALNWWLTSEVSELHQRRTSARLRSAFLGAFKLMDEYDWNWPEQIPRNKIEGLLNCDFIAKKENIALIGPEGVGKTMIAKNLAYNAIHRGMRARFVTAPKMINDLGNYKPSPAKEKAFTKYVSPHVLIIDEIGYINYDVSAANDLYEIISRRYEKTSTIITTNQAIVDWGEFFPGAACAMSLIDRFVHHVHVIDIDGPSWRLKECKERSENKPKGESNAKEQTKPS